MTKLLRQAERNPPRRACRPAVRPKKRKAGPTLAQFSRLAKI
jgi:hypothetical protein